jgi:hypothetical protein
VPRGEHSVAPLAEGDPTTPRSWPVFFASQLLPAFNWAFAWPVALIALGALLIIRSARPSP